MKIRIWWIYGDNLRIRTFMHKISIKAIFWMKINKSKSNCKISNTNGRIKNKNKQKTTNFNQIKTLKPFINNKMMTLKWNSKTLIKLTLNIETHLNKNKSNQNHQLHKPQKIYQHLKYQNHQFLIIIKRKILHQKKYIKRITQHNPVIKTKTIITHYQSSMKSSFKTTQKQWLNSSQVNIIKFLILKNLYSILSNKTLTHILVSKQLIIHYFNLHKK